MTNKTKTDGKTSIRKIPKGNQRNKLNLILDNSELDTFEEVINGRMSETDLKRYIKSQISKLRSNQ